MKIDFYIIFDFPNSKPNKDKITGVSPTGKVSVGFWDVPHSPQKARAFSSQ